MRAVCCWGEAGKGGKLVGGKASFNILQILRAVDRQYHPQCFKCIDCSTCLDGVPFTMDSSKNVLCVGCYNKLVKKTSSDRRLRLMGLLFYIRYNINTVTRFVAGASLFD